MLKPWLNYDQDELLSESGVVASPQEVRPASVRVMGSWDTFGPTHSFRHQWSGHKLSTSVAKVVRWKHDRSAYAFRDQQHFLDVASFVCARAIAQGLLDAAAFHTNPDSQGYRPAASEINCLRQLERQGLVSCSPATTGPSVGCWFLTAAGTKSLSRFSLVGSPQPVFSVNPALPLADAAPYELLLKLDQQGYLWKHTLSE